MKIWEGKMKIWGLFAASLPSIDLAEKLFDIRKDDIELGGSTGAERVSWGSRKWIRKIQNSNQLKEELIADLIYHHLNVPVPPSKIYNINGTFMKLSVYLEGSTEVAHHLLKATNKTQTLIHLQKDYQQNFIVDAYLANWDVLGGLGDNIRVYHEKIYRVGSL